MEEEKKMFTNSSVADAMNVLRQAEQPEQNVEVQDVQEVKLAETGMIMDAVATSTEADKAKEEAATAAITNDRIRQILAARRHTTMVRENGKIQRNEPCPCGSGKKYKNCCLKTGEYEKLVPAKKYAN